MGGAASGVRPGLIPLCFLQPQAGDRGTRQGTPPLPSGARQEPGWESPYAGGLGRWPWSHILAAHLCSGHGKTLKWWSLVPLFNEALQSTHSMASAGMECSL